MKIRKENKINLLELKTVDLIFCFLFYFSFTFTFSFILELGISVISQITITS